MADVDHSNEFVDVDRTGTDSLKHSICGPDVIPMWVADMDLATPVPIQQAIQKRAAHPIMGYSLFPDRVKNAIASWGKRRNGWDIDPACISFSSGVVPAVNIAVHAFTAPGDKIFVLSPTYYPMFWAVETNGRRLVISELKAERLGARYEMDWEDIAAKLADPQCMLAIFCSPQNPVGRMWTREELVRFASLCREHDVLVLSDEIHSDIILPPSDVLGPAPAVTRHIPFASVSEDARQRTITVSSPSKTFNIASLYFAYVVIHNQRLLTRWNNFASRVGIFPMPCLAIGAVEAAYGDPECEAWVDRLRAHIAGNRDLVARFITDRANGLADLVTATPLDATYLMWLDCRKLAARLNLATGPYPSPLSAWVEKHACVALSDGAEFGVGGAGFLRMNLGCARATVQRALERIRDAASAAHPADN